MTLAPLPVPQEELVVVDIRDGIADTTIVHLPKRRIEPGGFTFDSYDFAPATWPPVCGLIRSGWVYVRAGMLEDARVCPDCEALA